MRSLLFLLCLCSASLAPAAGGKFEAVARNADPHDAQVILIGNTSAMDDGRGTFSLSDEYYRQAIPLIRALSKSDQDMLLLENLAANVLYPEIPAIYVGLFGLRPNFFVGGWDNDLITSFAVNHINYSQELLARPGAENALKSFAFKKASLSLLLNDRNKSLVQAIQKYAQPGRKVFILASGQHVIDEKVLTFLDVNKISFISFVDEEVLGRMASFIETQKVDHAELLAYGFSLEHIAQYTSTIEKQLRAKLYQVLGREPGPEMVFPEKSVKRALWISRGNRCDHAGEG